MDAIARNPSSKIVAVSCGRRHFKVSGAIIAPAVQFVRLPKFVVPGRSILLKKKTVPSVVLSSPSDELEADAETQGSQIQPNQMKTVRVKFKLPKACLFGQHFFLIGDDPIFGLWDPLNAIPLEWSEGHLWTTELDVPIGKAIQFKFILRGSTGYIEWQPGPDRNVLTWETENTIVVSEDWENAELQKITEETSSLIEETMTNLAKELAEKEILEAKNDRDVTHTNSASSNGSSIIAQEEISVLVPGLAPASASEEIAVLVPGLAPASDSEEIAVLVPGLAPASASQSVIEEEIPEIREGIPEQDPKASHGNLTEGKINHCDDFTREIVPGDVPGEKIVSVGELDSQAPVDDVLKNDIQWGHKTLHRFIFGLSFLKKQFS